MSVYSGPRTSTDNVLFHVDAANKKSYTGSGTTAYDLSQYSSNGSLANGLTVSSNVFNFDGVDDTINCGAASQIGSSLTGLTVSAIVYPTSASTRCIAENGSSHTTNTFYLFQENSTNFTFEVYGTNFDVVYSSYTYQLNTWYHLVGVWSSGNRVELYTNGNLTSGTRSGVAQTSVINGNTNLFIGTRSGTLYPFSGKIASVKIYSRALTAAEIKRNFAARRGRFGI